MPIKQISGLQRAQQIGKILKTPTVLFGSVTTFIEREGSALGIRKPASIGFTVQLIHAEDDVERLLAVSPWAKMKAR